MRTHHSFHVKLCRYTFLLSIFLSFSGLVQAGAWKNLCPDTQSCVTQPLIYPDKVTVLPSIIRDRVSKTPVSSVQLPNGNWVLLSVSFGISVIWVFDDEGNLIQNINLRAGDTLNEVLAMHQLVAPVMQSKGTVYAFTSRLGGSPLQVFTSTDGGLIWSKHTPPFSLPDHLVVPNPNATPVFTGNRLQEIPAFTGWAMTDNPFANGILFLGSQVQSNLSGLYNLTLTEGGLKFDLLGATDIELVDFAIDPASIGSRESTLFGITQAGHLFRSQDAGKHWQFQSQIQLDKVSNNEIATGIEVIRPVLVNDSEKPLLLVSTSTQILSSNDEGANWQSFSFGLPSGRQSIHYVNDQLLVSNQSGWYRCDKQDCWGNASPVSQVFTGELQTVEFYNSQLDHYFLTADSQEIASIESGSAGPGWSRTGWDFSVWPPLAHPFGYGKLVCRFYGSLSPGPNSHFFTASSDECAHLQALQQKTPDTDARWNFEGFAFAVEAVDADTAQCRENRRAVYRAYNNGFARGIDSNHRFVPDQAEIEKMVNQGWVNEGIAFCVAK